MSRRQKDPLRPLSDAERLSLSRLSRSRSAPAAQVARARAVLAVADGQSYAMAAELVGRATGGYRRALGGGLQPRSPGRGEAAAWRRSLGALRRGRAAAPPGRGWPGAGAARDGTAAWSLTTLRDAPRRAGGGLPGVSTYTI